MKEIYNFEDLKNFLEDDSQTKTLLYSLTLKKRKRCVGVFDKDGYRLISIKYISSRKMCFLIKRLLDLLVED